MWCSGQFGPKSACSRDLLLLSTNSEQKYPNAEDLLSQGAAATFHLISLCSWSYSDKTIAFVDSVSTAEATTDDGKQSLEELADTVVEEKISKEQLTSVWLDCVRERVCSSAPRKHARGMSHVQVAC